MSRKSKKVSSLLGRFQFVDLAESVSVTRARRKDFLRNYLKRAMVNAQMPSYEHFRRQTPDIFGAVRGLDPSPPQTFANIERSLLRNCRKGDGPRNVEAAKLLFEFVRPKGFECYTHPAHDLPLGPYRRAAIRVQQYLVEDARGVFPFAYPRRKRLSGDHVNLMLSLIHHNYCQGDYLDFGVQIYDLGCDPVVGPRGGISQGTHRKAVIHTLGKDDLVPREQLSEEIQNVYQLLIEIGEEPDDR